MSIWSNYNFAQKTTKTLARLSVLPTHLFIYIILCPGSCYSLRTWNHQLLQLCENQSLQAEPCTSHAWARSQVSAPRCRLNTPSISLSQWKLFLPAGHKTVRAGTLVDPAYCHKVRSGRSVSQGLQRFFKHTRGSNLWGNKTACKHRKPWLKGGKWQGF